MNKNFELLQEQVDNLILSLKKEIKNKNTKTSNIDYLEKTITDFKKQKTCEFMSSYSFYRIKNIFDLLLNIIKVQEKRISKLEN